MSASLSRVSNTDSLVLEFIRDLENTTELVSKLLSDVRESEVDFSVFKIELRLLGDNVRVLSSILRDGEAGVSLVTRMALMEQRVKELEKDLEKEMKKNEEVTTADKAGRWQMKVAVATGILGLLAGIGNVVISAIFK